MTEPITNYALSVKLKEAGAPTSITVGNRYYGIGGEHPYLWDFECDGRVDTSLCVRAFTAGELLTVFENAGLLVRLTHWKAGIEEGYGVEAFRGGERVAVDDRETAVEALGQLYLQILTKQGGAGGEALPPST